MTLFCNITTTPPFREPRTLTPPLTASSRTRTHSLHLRFRFASRSPPVPNTTPPASTFLRSLSGRMADTRHCRLSFSPSRINQDIAPRPSSCRPRGRVYRPGMRSHPTYAHAATRQTHGSCRAVTVLARRGAAAGSPRGGVSEVRMSGLNAFVFIGASRALRLEAYFIFDAS